MGAFPDHGGVKPVDRSDNIGIPTLQATHCQRPKGAKVDDFMTRGIGSWQYAGQSAVAGVEVIKVIRRDRAEAPSSPGNSLTRTRAREDDNMKSTIASKGRHLVCHCPKIENIDVI